MRKTAVTKVMALIMIVVMAMGLSGCEKINSLFPSKPTGVYFDPIGDVVAPVDDVNEPPVDISTPVDEGNPDAETSVSDTQPVKEDNPDGTGEAVNDDGVFETVTTITSARYARDNSTYVYQTYETPIVVTLASSAGVTRTPYGNGYLYEVIEDGCSISALADADEVMYLIAVTAPEGKTDIMPTYISGMMENEQSELIKNGVAGTEVEADADADKNTSAEETDKPRDIVYVYGDINCEEPSEDYLAELNKMFEDTWASLFEELFEGMINDDEPLPVEDEPSEPAENPDDDSLSWEDFFGTVDKEDVNQ